MTDLTLFQTGATLAAADNHGCLLHITYLKVGVVGPLVGTVAKPRPLALNGLRAASRF